MSPPPTQDHKLHQQQRRMRFPLFVPLPCAHPTWDGHTEHPGSAVLPRPGEERREAAVPRSDALPPGRLP